jgi:hypothetical protein
MHHIALADNLDSPVKGFNAADIFFIGPDDLHRKQA